MNSDSYSYYPKTVPAKKSSKAPLVVLIVVLVLSAVCTGLFFLVRNDPAVTVTRALTASVKAAGSSEPVTVLSDVLDTIPYEIFTSIPKRVKRVLVD